MNEQATQAAEDVMSEELLAATRGPAVIANEHESPNGDSIELSCKEEAPETGTSNEADDSAETATNPERDRMSEQTETTTAQDTEDQQPEETAPERDETTEATESTDTSTETSEDTTSTQEEETKPAPTKDWEAEAEKWKRLSRENEAKAKANRAELARIKAEGNSSKSELEKLADRVAAAEERAAKAERQALIADIAEETGLSTKQAARLKGDTKEDLLADAAEMKKLFGLDKPATTDTDQDTKKTTAPSRPQEKLRPGASSENDELDPDEVANAVLAKKRV